jgi:ketosteroid isomerase-like protein
MFGRGLSSGQFLEAPVIRSSLALFLLALFAISSKTQTASSFVPCTREDEAQIQAILGSSSIDEPTEHVAPDLDWENAFGVRYSNLDKRNAFYQKYVTPNQKDAPFEKLEIKIRFVAPNVAYADEYWHETGQLDQKTGKSGPDRWGRTTYLFTKQNGAWSEVMERVADLRLPYFKHYESMPEPVPVAPEILASYAGSYETEAHKFHTEIKVDGNRLEVKAEGFEPSVGIATSPTEFVMLNPNDVAEYYKGVFSKAADGSVELTLLSFTDRPIGKLTKMK